MRLVGVALIVVAACGGGGKKENGHGPAHAHGEGAAHGGMQHSFEGAEKWAAVFDDPARDAWQKPDEVVALLAIEPGMTVADLGAGTGYFLARLSRAVGESGRVIATDLEPDMVRYMGERATREGLANVEVRQVAADDPGLDAGAVDRVLVVDVWHHISDRVAYARKLAAALRPGGRVVIVDFTMESPEGPPVEHRLEAATIVGELEAAGLAAAVLDEDGREAPGELGMSCPMNMYGATIEVR